jgi:small subunit ribosomal protein S8
MAMSDPIADMLTRLRNATRAGKATVDIPASHIKENICAVLKREGFIEDYELTAPLDVPRSMLRVSLRYGADRSSVIQGLRRVSRPSLRTYAKRTEIRMIRSGMGIAIMSTPKGVMTSKQARTAKVGGEVLCEVW